LPFDFRAKGGGIGDLLGFKWMSRRGNDVRYLKATKNLLAELGLEMLSSCLEGEVRFHSERRWRAGLIPPGLFNPA
jgi:hypothetical protein